MTEVASRRTVRAVKKARRVVDRTSTTGGQARDGLSARLTVLMTRSKRSNWRQLSSPLQIFWCHILLQSLRRSQLIILKNLKFPSSQQKR